MNPIKWLEKWYMDQCNEDWEHSYGITIETLDNPGWAVFIDLSETEFENKTYDGFKMDNGDSDWLQCRVKDGKFEAFGDPSKLDTIILIFKEWVEQ